MQLSNPPFNASPVQVLQLLSRQGKFFYLPRYQRPYAWTHDNLNEFVSDINGGLKQVIDGGVASKSALTFLGAAIFLPTNGNSDAIFPSSNRAEAPQDIAVVIDGQQRITTLLMTCAALAGQIDDLLAQTPTECSPMMAGVVRRATELRNSLWRALGEDRVGAGDNVFNYYPRMIRENDDLWSADQHQAKYRSPIASLLSHALGWVHERSRHQWRQSDGRDFVLQTSGSAQAPEPKAALPKVNEEFNRRFFDLKQLLRDVAKGSPELLSPAPDEVFCARTFTDLLRCMEREIDQGELEQLCTMPEGQRDPPAALRELTRTVLFAEYLRHRVYVTEVTAPDEENAFDLFQALNTRGEPLTAYETFKPIVVERVPRQNAPRYTELVASMERVDNVIAEAGNDAREQLTQQLLIYAAAYENGHKLGKNIREQRKWLKGNLVLDGRQRTPDELIDVVGGIDRVAQAHRAWVGWQRRDHGSDAIPEGFAAGRLAAEVLADAKHTVVVPILTPFIAAIEHTPLGSNERLIAQTSLDSVLRALLATATLWRLAFGGTEGIDDALRSVMSGGAGISRRQCPHPSHQNVHVTMVIESLRQLLKRGGQRSGRSGSDLLVAETWTELAANQPIYRKASKFARFALAASFNRATTSAGKPWLLEDGLGQVNVELSNRALWWSCGYNIEHLAPQSRASDFKDHVVHGLGNLTLTPSWVNSSLSDSEWPRKRRLFQLMATRSKDGADAYVATLRKEDLLDLQVTNLDRIDKEGINPEVATSIAALPQELTPDVLHERCYNLLARVHRRMLEWLG